MVSPKSYDDFENPAFAGQFNPELWEPWEDLNKCNVGQEDGALRFSCTQPEGSGLNALRYEDVEFGQIGFVEARLKLDSNLSAGHGAVSVLLSNSLDSWAECGLDREPELKQAQLSCSVASYRNDTFSEEYRANAPSVAYGTWHTVRIEMDPDSGEYTFFVEGQPIGAHTPADIKNLRSAQFQAQLRVYLEDGSLVTGYLDDIRIGPPE